jgi:hypothetical protein
MNCFQRIAKDFRREQRRRKTNSMKNIVVVTVAGIVVGGAITVLITEKCCEKIKQIVIGNEKDIDKDINIKRNEIKETLENVGDESLGDVGIEMKKALDDLED